MGEVWGCALFGIVLGGRVSDDIFFCIFWSTGECCLTN